MPARPPEPSCLYPDEAEVARLVLGTKRARLWPGLAVLFERQGMPPVDVQTGGRYWPRVLKFLNDRDALAERQGQPARRPGIVENFDYPATPRRGSRRDG